MSTKKPRRIKKTLAKGIHINQTTELIIPQIIVNPTIAMPRPSARKIPLLSYNQETILPRPQNSNMNSVLLVGSQLSQTSTLKPPLPPRTELHRRTGAPRSTIQDGTIIPRGNGHGGNLTIKRTLTKHHEKLEQERDDTESTRRMHHIAYTPNLIPTPHMRQRKTRKEKFKKKETSTPNVNKDTCLSLTTNEGGSYWRKKIDPREKEIIKPWKIIPTKLQTHLNKLEPHGYIKNAARARSTRLCPIRRKTLQWSLLKVPVPEWQTQIIVGDMEARTHCK
jgi:hypothetical protein